MTRNFLVLAAFALLLAPVSFADQKSAHDLITSMKGCYEVNFHFVETGTTDPNYKIHSQEYNENALEWVDLDLDSDHEVHLQHILVLADGAMKHWRQEWQFEPTVALQYFGNLTWDTLNLDSATSAGKWIQRVYQVDDSPRYECVAAWSNSAWGCSTYSPLPRREFSKRSDYNVLDRTNQHIITQDGWLHAQNNRKMVVDEKGATQIATEYGLDTYKRVDSARCKTAQTYWTENKEIWHSMQDMWRHIRGHHTRLQFLGKVEGQPLWAKMFDLAEATAQEVKTSGTLDVKSLLKKTHDLIHTYFVE